MTTLVAPSEVTGDHGDPAENRLLVTRVVTQFWNGKDIAGHTETHSSYTIAHKLVIAGNPLEVDGYNQATLMHLAALPDFHVDVDAPIAEPDKGAARWTVTATHQGDLMGTPA